CSSSKGNEFGVWFGEGCLVQWLGLMRDTKLLVVCDTFVLYSTGEIVVHSTRSSAYSAIVVYIIFYGRLDFRITRKNLSKVRRRAEIQQARALAGNDTIQSDSEYMVGKLLAFGYAVSDNAEGEIFGS
ncbi:hypothetical protein Tco_1421690, partial [Tanacetum coccineum]